MLPYDYSAVVLVVVAVAVAVVDIVILFGGLPSPSSVLRESAISSDCLKLFVVLLREGTLCSGV